MFGVDNDWKDILAQEVNKPYYTRMMDFVEQEYQSAQIFPSREQMFRAFELTPYQDVKVVILGQDPYHGEHQAHGLSFSVPRGVKVPPSLVNIYKELHSDLGVAIPTHGCLETWAKQGVLMLNTVLTVRAHAPFSHRGKGWEQFTDQVIRILNEKSEPIVFILWGKPAQEKKQMLDASKHCIIEAPHPSPLSAYRGFFGSKPFSQANEFLQRHQQTPICWSIDDVE